MNRGNRTKEFAGGIAWIIAVALQVIPQAWPNVLPPHPWAVGICIVGGAALFVYAAFEHKELSGASNTVGRNNSGDLINAKDSVVHKGDYHYHESAGTSQEELDKRFNELESRINSTGGIMVNGVRVCGSTKETLEADALQAAKNMQNGLQEFISEFGAEPQKDTSLEDQTPEGIERTLNDFHARRDPWEHKLRSRYMQAFQPAAKVLYHRFVEAGIDNHHLAALVDNTDDRDSFVDLITTLKSCALKVGDVEL